MTEVKDVSYELAKTGKKGNLICKFATFHDDTVYELRECPYDNTIYVIFWDEEIHGCGYDNFTNYTKSDVEEPFAEKSWKVLGNKCKRAIFK